MFNLLNLLFTGGGLHCNVSHNLSTLARTGGGRLNECKSNEGNVRTEKWKFRAYCSLRQVISVHHLAIQPTVRACNRSKYTAVYVSNVPNQIGRDTDFFLCNSFNQRFTDFIARASNYSYGYKLNNRKGLPWISGFTTFWLTRRNESNCVRLNLRNEVVA